MVSEVCPSPPGKCVLPDEAEKTNVDKVIELLEAYFIGETRSMKPISLISECRRSVSHLIHFSQLYVHLLKRVTLAVCKIG